MLEAEATTKLCPFTMQPMAGTSAYTLSSNGDTYIPNSFPIAQPLTCVGSQCMAWEPTQSTTVLDIGKEGYCKLVEERNL
jgi:hypothetical protein